MSPNEQSSPSKQKVVGRKALESKPEDPFSVRNKTGQTSIVVYPIKAREGFVFRYRLGGVEKTVERVTREKIIAAALKVAADIDSGIAQAGQLTAADVESYVHARKLLLAGDPPLHAIVAEWQAARRHLDGRGSIVDAAREWAARLPARLDTKKTVGQIVAEMLDAKRKGRGGLEPNYQRNLQRCLRKFAEVCKERPIGEIRESMILEHLHGLEGIGGRTRQNVRANIIQLFRFAQKRGYLAEDRTTEAEKVEREHVVRKSPAVLTPDELRKYLAHVRGELLPWMVIVAFSGVRSEEVAGDPLDPAQEQLAWSDIIWEEKQIYIRPEVGKTDEGRYVPIENNLMQWLLRWRDRAGLVCPQGARLNNETLRLGGSKVTGIKWRRNCLRHSFGSYWYALHRDLGRLTAYMGNSVSINRKNYQNPRSRTQAEDWFSILPPATLGRVVVKGNFRGK